MVVEYRFYLYILFTRGTKNNWVKLEPPIIIAVMKPICIAPPPDSMSMAGITVSTTIKFYPRARKPACHKNALKLLFDNFGVKIIF
jgi:hypothetical protein